MKDQGSQKGKSRKPESSGTVPPPAGAEGKVSPVKASPMTSKEKIAANQRNKRRR